MDIKFNSLFDNDATQDDTTYYTIDTIDTTLLLSNLVLQRDEEKQRGIEKLNYRQFGNYPNYILSGRPCSDSLCSSKKFCDSAGWPESPIFKRKNKCEMPLAPNAVRGDPNIWADNIDMESKLKKIDIIESKCPLKKHKEDPCSKNPDNCPLNCHKDSIAVDYMLPKNNKYSTNNKQINMNLSNQIRKSQKIQSNFCKKLSNKIDEVKLFNTNIQTKRRNQIDW